MHDAGGRVQVIIAGVPYSARGELSLQTSRISVETIVNQDGSVGRITKPKSVQASVTFDRFVTATGEYLEFTEATMRAKFAGTFIEDDTDIVHMITGAGFTGSPELNTATGEVSGLVIEGSAYRRTA